MQDANISKLLYLRIFEAQLAGDFMESTQTPINFFKGAVEREEV